MLIVANLLNVNPKGATAFEQCACLCGLDSQLDCLTSYMSAMQEIERQEAVGLVEPEQREAEEVLEDQVQAWYAITATERKRFRKYVGQTTFLVQAIRFYLIMFNACIWFYLVAQGLIWALYSYLLGIGALLRVFEFRVHEDSLGVDGVCSVFLILCLGGLFGSIWRIRVYSNSGLILHSLC